MDYTKELKILEIIKKHIYCDKHSKDDEIIHFCLIKSVDKENYELVKNHFNLVAKELKPFSIDNSTTDTKKSFYERNK